MNQTIPIDIKTKLENDLVNFRKISEVENNLVEDRNYMINNNMVNLPIYNAINDELNSHNVLCNRLYQMTIPYDKTSFWKPLLNEKRIGCGYNVLSFLNIISEKSAISKITCMDVDTGLTMSNIKNMIVKNKKISDSLQIQRIVFNYENLKNIIYNQLDFNHATIVRLYQNQNDISGHTVIFYKSIDARFVFIDPQYLIYAVFDYVNGLFTLVPWKITNVDYASTIDYINKCTAFEFFTINPRLNILPQPKKTTKFEPMVLTEDIPFHMFLLVSHGASVYSDRTKTSLKFPFHSLGFYVDKNVVLHLDNPRIKIEDVVNNVSDSMNNYIRKIKRKYGKQLISSPEVSDVIINTTGEIDVYPMYWSIDLNDYKTEFMGLYHLLYNDLLKKFEIVNQIFDYNYFIDKTTGLPLKLYYSDIIKKCNNYYSENRQTLFKKISRKLIYLGIFSCRNPDEEYLYMASPNENLKENRDNQGVIGLKQHIMNRKLIGGSPSSSPKMKLEMVSQDELLNYVIQNQQNSEAIRIQSQQTPTSGIVAPENIVVSSPLNKPSSKTKSKRTRKNKRNAKNMLRKSIKKFMYRF